MSQASSSLSSLFSHRRPRGGGGSGGERQNVTTPVMVMEVPVMCD